MDELTKIALVGTSKFAGPVSSSQHPAAALVPSTPGDDREGALLLGCGAQSVFSLAGRRSVASIGAVVPSPPETKKAASRKLAMLIEAAIADNRKDLLLDFLSQMREQEVVLPPELLPLLLEAKDPEMRRSLIPVLGERGTWLCRQNQEWSWFDALLKGEQQADLDDLRRTLDEGTIDDRCRALELLRRQDPDSAREWVENVLPREKHGNRVKLLKSLEAGLHDGDEAFLEGCLDDRNPAVGQAAAWLLCNLPQSALAGRMRSRAEAMFAIEKKGPALEEIKLVCTPPTEIEPDWERDGFTRKPPTGVGLRAFWAEHLLASVPPSHWSRRFGLVPRSLIDAVADDPFAGSVISGWTKAATRFAKADTPSTEWVTPLLQYHAGWVGALADIERKFALVSMKSLLSLMAPDLAESSIVGLFEAERENVVDIAMETLPALARPWSAGFSTRFLALVRGRLQTGTDAAAYGWAVALTQCACAMPASTFSLALAPWKVPAPEESSTWFATAVTREIEKFTTTIEKRQSFFQELNQ